MSATKHKTGLKASIDARQAREILRFRGILRFPEILQANEVFDPRKFKQNNQHTPELKPDRYY